MHGMILWYLLDFEVSFGVDRLTYITQHLNCFNLCYSDLGFSVGYEYMSNTGRFNFFPHFSMYLEGPWMVISPYTYPKICRLCRHGVEHRYFKKNEELEQHRLTLYLGFIIQSNHKNIWNGLTPANGKEFNILQKNIWTKIKIH